MIGSTAPAPAHDGFRNADALTSSVVARIPRVPSTSASVTVVEATPCEFVTVGVWLIVSDAEGLVTNDQTTDCPETGAPLASTNVAVSVKGAPQETMPWAATVTDPLTWDPYPKAGTVAAKRSTTAAVPAIHPVRRFTADLLVLGLPPITPCPDRAFNGHR